jgi:hypothetical protein
MLVWQAREQPDFTIRLFSAHEIVKKIISVTGYILNCRILLI